MDVHVPKSPIVSVKHLIVELATITLGILIALSLEGLTGWFHHRALVREARENILHEMADNRKELDNALSYVPDSVRDLKAVLSFVGDHLAGKKTEVHSLRMSYIIAQLHTASRSTAEATGALGYMDYAEVSRYTEVYETQQQFTRLQDRLLDAWVPMLNATQTGDPEKATPQEFQAWKDSVLTALSYLQTEDGIGKSLSSKYAKALSAR